MQSGRSEEGSKSLEAADPHRVWHLHLSPSPLLLPSPAAAAARLAWRRATQHLHTLHTAAIHHHHSPLHRATITTAPLSTSAREFPCCCSFFPCLASASTASSPSPAAAPFLLRPCSSFSSLHPRVAAASSCDFLLPSPTLLLPVSSQNLLLLLLPPRTCCCSFLNLLLLLFFFYLAAAYLSF